MEKNWKRLVLLFSGFLLVFSYQNCSVYQSDGRKFIEKNGLAGFDSLAQSSNTNDNSNGASSGSKVTKLSLSDCSPYLTNEQAKSFTSDSVTSQFLFDPNRNELSCLLSYEKNILCTISPENLALALGIPNSVSASDMTSDPIGSFDGTSFGYIKRNADKSVTLNFLGALKAAPEAIVCSEVFASEADLQADIDNSVERLARIVHAMSPMTSSHNPVFK